MELLLFVLLTTLLGLAAVRWGVDSTLTMTDTHRNEYVSEHRGSLYCGGTEWQEH